MFRYSRKVAFTLIELLAVVAVIAILVAITIPVIGQVRTRAETIKCATNLRSMGALFSLYATDHGNKLPVASVGEAAGLKVDYWRKALLSYLELESTNPQAIFNTPAFVCPEVQKVLLQNGLVPERRDINGFGMNNYLSGIDRSLISNPERTLLASEARVLGSSTTPTEILDVGSFANRTNYHRDFCHLLYADGHVEAFEKIERIYLPPYTRGSESDIWSPN